MARMGFLLMGKIMAVTGPLWCCKMRYMGLKLGVFLQTGVNLPLDSNSFESGGLRVFFGTCQDEVPGKHKPETGLFYLRRFTTRFFLADT